MRRALALLAATLLLAACGREADAGRPADPAASTRIATLADPDGDGILTRVPGEPLVPRADLGPAGRPGATLATLGILADLHVRDEESPARVPFLDRLGGPFSSTFRPQEALSPQVLAAAVRALDAQRPDAVLVAGDITDSGQENELDQALAVLDGGRVDPDSGGPGYDGVQEERDPDPLFYRPDLDAPRHPGLLDAAQRPFRSPGLDAPWYPALGNHDVLVAGEIPPTPRIQSAATGDRLVTGIDPAALPRGAATPASAAATVDRLLAAGAGRAITVPADPRRRILAPTQLVDRLARRTGVAPGSPRLDYAKDVGGLRVIVLDTPSRAGGPDADLLPGQVAWLRQALAAAGARPVLVLAHQALEGGTGAAAEALALLDADPRVLALVDGDTHHDRIRARRTPAGGYWEITTSSLADFPQQARMLRVRRAAAGYVLETWMVDQDGRGLAGTARELAFLDAQGGRPQGFAGRREDRNATLPVPRGT
jgi:3',5'-cyclic AMP phosphodiesterase CpdA